MSDISNTKKYAIYWMNHSGSDVSSISSELKISKDKILEILGDQVSSATRNENKENHKINTKDLMITKTSVKGNNSVAIMTKEASEINDSKRSKYTNQSNDIEKGIFRPNKQ